MGSGLAAGTIFAGRYRIVQPIAAGGMGAVYEVIHLETERRRALKVMHPHIVESDELRGRFQREAKVAAHVESDFIVDVFDAGVDEATQMPFLVMELLRGEELGKRLKRLGRFEPADVVTYLHQTALALDKTHRASIVHRDLKPPNLFLTERDDGPPRIKVLDFGIAKIVAESATSGATLSMGTPLYMAPEQFDPHVGLTPAADLYALAMVAYTFLVGAAYFAEEGRRGNVFSIAAAVALGIREPASARAAPRGVVLPPSFDAWFARATALDPARRFAVATEMIAALAQALGVPLSVAPRPGPVFVAEAPPMESAPVLPPAQITAPGMATTNPAPFAQRRGAAFVVVIAAAALAVATAALYFGSHRRPARTRTESGVAAAASPEPPAPSEAPAAPEAPPASVSASTTMNERSAPAPLPSLSATAPPSKAPGKPAAPPRITRPSDDDPPPKTKYTRD